ncbi:hypothetical protein ABZ079_16015 [Streptomyces sp. NPDC006314]|uniref:hypothetical protein n=1 Tax=Streptomyces sp. NPDC006314 TaxID=3154475 RepID=UPI0033B589E5
MVASSTVGAPQVAGVFGSGTVGRGGRRRSGGLARAGRPAGRTRSQKPYGIHGDESGVYADDTRLALMLRTK